MRRGGRALVGLALAIGLTGCASGARGPSGPVRSPTGIVYEPGTPPTRSRFSQTAALLLSQGVLDRALAIAQEGIQSDTANPIHFFLAGLAQVRIGQYEDAHRNFTIAQRIYPAYELEIEPERRAAWVKLYNDGTEAYNNGEIEEAIWLHGASGLRWRTAGLRPRARGAAQPHEPVRHRGSLRRRGPGFRAHAGGAREGARDPPARHRRGA